MGAPPAPGPMGPEELRPGAEEEDGGVPGELSAAGLPRRLHAVVKEDGDRLTSSAAYRLAWPLHGESWRAFAAKGDHLFAGNGSAHENSRALTEDGKLRPGAFAFYTPDEPGRCAKSSSEEAEHKRTPEIDEGLVVKAYRYLQLRATSVVLERPEFRKTIVDYSADRGRWLSSQVEATGPDGLHPMPLELKALLDASLKTLEESDMIDPLLYYYRDLDALMTFQDLFTCELWRRLVIQALHSYQMRHWEAALEVWSFSAAVRNQRLRARGGGGRGPPAEDVGELQRGCFRLIAAKWMRDFSDLECPEVVYTGDSGGIQLIAVARAALLAGGGQRGERLGR